VRIPWNEVSQQARDRIEEVLRDFLAQADELDGGGGLVTDWVIVAETNNGRPWLHALTSENLTSWKRNGMLEEMKITTGYESEADD